MKVYVLPADQHGCGHYRLIWPSEVLRSLGVDVTIVGPDERDDVLVGVMDPATDTLVDVRIPDDADVFVLQRVTHRHISAAIRKIREKGVAVVVDMDDDLTCIDPRNPAYALMHPANNKTELERSHSWHNALDACRDATLVTVSTAPLLMRYAPQGTGLIFDNYIKEDLLRQERHDNAVVGWAGSLHSHPGDLQTMGSSVNRLLQEEVEVAVIGAIEGIHGAWGVPGDRPIQFTGPTTVHDWPRAVGKLGIGVAPLVDTKFNRAKSWLKALEYAATGVPYVAADMPQYNRLYAMGAGCRATKPNQWYANLKILATDERLREELSERGRAVAAGLTIEGNAWKLGEIWAEALTRERSKALGAWSRR